MAGTKKKAEIRRLVFHWYSHRGRKLPWRGIRDPYGIVVAEIMLQQTQVGRVLQKYPPFLRTFPSFRSLAEAPLRDVIDGWDGLGYNNRAVRLHALARALTANHAGRLPANVDDLKALPGIGRYTAAALAVSVHGKAMPVVDTNVRRFLSRLLWRMKRIDDVQDEKRIWQTASELLPARRVYDWTQALMDIGATVCTARRPACSSCPVARLCISRRGMKRRVRTVPTTEPARRGIPNRIYRGRVVSLLRHGTAGRCLPVNEIGRQIYLEKDGVVRIHPTRVPPCVSLG
jgi:A/G-specific adenine glycosylase